MLAVLLVCPIVTGGYGISTRGERRRRRKEEEDPAAEAPQVIGIVPPPIVRRVISRRPNTISPDVVTARIEKLLHERFGALLNERRLEAAIQERDEEDVEMLLLSMQQ